MRGLDRHMPAFGDALSPDDITSRDRPHPCLLPGPGLAAGRPEPAARAFFTEKAFPENEAVWTMAMTGSAERSVESELIYERRVGPRNQIEVVAPIVAQESATREWRRGFGDVALAFKRTLYASMRRRQIGAAGIEVILPTGNESRGLGKGYTVFEPFAMWGQLLPRNSFLQFHAGVELPSDGSKGVREVFIRSAIGTTVAGGRGFGRAWSPQLEVLWARPERSPSEWDVVPQIQVTLSKLQHVMLAAGVRVPLTQRDERHAQALVYLLWIGSTVDSSRCGDEAWPRVHLCRGDPVVGLAAGHGAGRATPVTRARSVTRRRAPDVSMFAPSSECLACHNNLLHRSGRTCRSAPAGARP